MADMAGFGDPYNFEADDDDDGSKYFEHKRLFGDELKKRNSVAVHTGTMCDCCLESPIAGNRFSLVGYDFDLCASCYGARRNKSSSQ